MIPQEMIRRFPFFLDFSPRQIDTLTKAADDIYIEAGHTFFRAGEDLKRFYFVLEGEISIVISLPDRTRQHKFVDHLYNNFTTRDITVPSAGLRWSIRTKPPLERRQLPIAECSNLIVRS